MSLFDESYPRLAAHHGALGVRLAGLLTDLLSSQGVPVHSVTWRVKSRESAERKMQLSPEKYGHLEELHDLLGLRVITYFTDHVDRAASLVESEFLIDSERSADKKQLMDPDRFGYLSRHYVARIDLARSKLPEWSSYGASQFEIQVRSILQHSWAEIEHDLGYKSAHGIPITTRRRFARLAGLLELADDEFRAIRDDLERHAEGADLAVRAGESVRVDRDSVASLISQSETVRRVDQAIAARAGLPLAKKVSEDYASWRVDELTEVGLESTQAVLDRLKADEAGLIEFASSWLGRPGSSRSANKLNRGISLFYLYIHVGIRDKGMTPIQFGFFDGDESEEVAEFASLHGRVFDS